RSEGFLAEICCSSGVVWMTSPRRPSWMTRVDMKPLGRKGLHATHLTGLHEGSFNYATGDCACGSRQASPPSYSSALASSYSPSGNLRSLGDYSGKAATTKWPEPPRAHLL